MDTDKLFKVKNMNTFENKKDDLLKNSQEGELTDKEGAGAEDKKEEEASQEEIDKTLGEIKESVEDINKKLEGAKSIKSESESPGQRERNMFRERVDNWTESYAREVGEIKNSHKKTYLAIMGGAVFMGGMVAAIPYVEGKSFVESIQLLRTGFPMALGIFSEVMLAAAAVGVKIHELIDKADSRHRQDKYYFGGFDRFEKGGAEKQRKKQMKTAKLYQ